MKMVKSLLLGTAAGLVAVSGAQAADLPVKAKPVEYVKICTLYGEGYYYIPGSDTCIKFGGYVRARYGWNVATTTPAYTGTQGAQDRTVSQYSTQHRANLQLDSRTQTQYGTLRTFTSIHFDNSSGAITITPARAFIQWAGFTFGHAQSLSDTWGITDSWHYAQQQNNSDTGANGVNQIAYTWELGNGMTLSVGADEVRRKSLVNLSSISALKLGVEPATSFRGQQWPDAHIDFKINQAWGYWATSFIIHDVAASNYLGATPNLAAAFAFNPALQCGVVLPTANSNSPNLSCGRPNDKIGFSLNTGTEIKMDFITPGDRLGMGVRYAQGASGFGGGSNLASGSLFGAGTGAVGNVGTLAMGSMTDGTFVNGGQIQLTTTWTAMAAYEHFWSPQLKSSFSASYSQILHNAATKAIYATNVCPAAALTAASPPVATGSQAGFNGGTLPANCDPDWGFFQGGIRTQWEPVRNFLLGVDVFYTHVFTAFKGSNANVSGVNVSGTTGAVTLVNPIVGARPNGSYTLKDLGTVGAIFHAYRSFNGAD